MSNLQQEGRFSWLAGSLPDFRREFADDVRAGLTSDPKFLPCRYLYDARGSALFERICDEPEYYPTRVETTILANIASELAERFDAAPRLVELGSGSAQKTRLLIEALIARHGSLVFEPIDISRAALDASARALLADYPDLHVRAVAAEYVPGLHMLFNQKGETASPRLVLWLGSSIGNFHRPAAVEFLAALRAELRPQDTLLIGIDLRKDKSVLEAAYDDAAGVTAEFIKNLFVRINSEFGGAFDPTRFRYHARYDEEAGCVKMWLESVEPVRVPIRDLDFAVDLARGELVHIENSYKYSTAEIHALARQAGLEILAEWTDPDRLFCEVLLGS